MGVLRGLKNDSSEKRYRRTVSGEEALQKAKHFCAYQERCHAEVTEKLFQLGVSKKEQEEIKARLIEENYLNEERFAIAYAGGKFRIKNWGRKKIEYELKQKQVSAYCIKKALAQISDADYQDVLMKLIKGKKSTVKGASPQVRKKKITDYLAQRGFEFEHINKALERLG